MQKSKDSILSVDQAKTYKTTAKFYENNNTL